MSNTEQAMTVGLDGDTTRRPEKQVSPHESNSNYPNNFRMECVSDAMAYGDYGGIV